MAEPFLHFGDVGLVREGVGCGRRAERMHAEPVDLGADAGREAVMPHDVAIDRCGIERPVELLRRAVVLDGSEEGPADIGRMAGIRQILLNKSLGRGVYGNEADLVAFALDAEVHHTLTALHVADAQPAEFFAADAVIEQGGQDGAIALALERVFGRGVEQFAGLRIA